MKIELEIGKEYWHKRLQIRVKLIGLRGDYAVVEDRAGNSVATLKIHLQPNNDTVSTQQHPQADI